VDASGQIVGKLAQQVARLLQGKNKPFYTPAADCGDHVVILNADKVRFTGKKATDKVYYWHTGYPGGLKQRTAAEMMDRAPERILREAIKGMLPRNRLSKGKMLRRLRITATEENRWVSQCTASQAAAPKYLEAFRPRDVAQEASAAASSAGEDGDDDEPSIMPLIQHRISSTDPASIDLDAIKAETVTEPDFELFETVFAEVWAKEVKFWSDRRQTVPEDIYDRHGVPYPGADAPSMEPAEAAGHVATLAKQHWETQAKAEQDEALANLKEFKETDGAKWMGESRT
jgi:large subunit ribosomal protein L13